jgi:hypothetical protein
LQPPAVDITTAKFAAQAIRKAAEIGWKPLARFGEDFFRSGRGCLALLLEAIRLSPRDPQLFLDYLGIGMVRFLRRDDDGAIEMLHKAIALNPNFSPSNLYLVA